MLHGYIININMKLYNLIYYCTTINYLYILQINTYITAKIQIWIHDIDQHW